MSRRIKIGVLSLDVKGTYENQLKEKVEAATQKFYATIKTAIDVEVVNIERNGHTLVPSENGYPVLEFVQVGINEKTARRMAFLLIVTDVEIAAPSLPYFLALPSQLTNVAIISTRRLADYGSADLKNAPLMADRLSTLMIHCFGRLLNLSYISESDNYMSRIEVPESLDQMQQFTAAQLQQIKINLPKEANDRFSEGNKYLFVFQQTLGNLPRIIRGALRANPLRLASKLPTMIATALSVIIVLIFGAETWDFAAAATNGQLAIFTIASFLAASYLLYSSFSFQLVTTRSGKTSESSVVTAGATYLAVLLTLLTLFVLFMGIMYSVVVFVFPDALMSTWTSAEDGSSFSAHIRLVAFLAAVGVLSGSLGGSADSRSVVRNVLFAVDET